MSLLLNRAEVTTATTGTGTVTLGSAVAPYQTWINAQIGSFNTRRYSYLIKHSNGTDWEIGEGVFNEGANTLTRVLVASSTGALLNLTGTSTVLCVAKSSDLPQVIEKKDLTGLNTYAFLDIPPDFEDLELEIVGRSSDGGAIGAAVHQPAVRINNLSTAIYDGQRQFSQNATGAADQILAGTSWVAPSFPGTLVTDATCTGYFRLRFHGYSRTVLGKTGEYQARQPNNATSGNSYVMWGTIAARTAAAITRLDVLFLTGTVTFPTGSFAILRGIP